LVYCIDLAGGSGAMNDRVAEPTWRVVAAGADERVRDRTPIAAVRVIMSLGVAHGRAVSIMMGMRRRQRGRQREEGS
jgi:hypothetical protein